MINASKYQISGSNLMPMKNFCSLSSWSVETPISTWLRLRDTKVSFSHCIAWEYTRARCIRIDWKGNRITNKCKVRHQWMNYIYKPVYSESELGWTWDIHMQRQLDNRKLDKCPTCKRISSHPCEKMMNVERQFLKPYTFTAVTNLTETRTE